MGVAQLEKLRMEEHQKQQQQQQAESWVLPRNQHLIHRQMKAFQPPAFTIGGPSSHSLDLSSSHVGGLKDPIMSFAGLSLAPIHRRGMESVESSSCLTHVCMAPDSASVGIAAKETFQGLASEIYGAAVTQNENGLYEPSLWPPGPPTELPMVASIADECFIMWHYAHGAPFKPKLLFQHCLARGRYDSRQKTPLAFLPGELSSV